MEIVTETSGEYVIIKIHAWLSLVSFADVVWVVMAQLRASRFP